jgi:hypothetical protein
MHPKSETHNFRASFVDAYDQMGRLKGELQCTPGNCSGTSNSLQYTYDLAGNLTSSTNGVANPGVQLTNTYDWASRLLSVVCTWSDSEHPPTLFSVATSSTVACGPNPSVRSYAEVLRLRAIKPTVCDRSAKRFAQDDGFVAGLEIQVA